MNTAALSLHDLFNEVSNHKPPEESVLTAIVTLFEFEPSQIGEAAKIVHNLVDTVFSDIENAPHNEQMKKILARNAHPFSGLRAFNGFGARVVDAKNNGILKPDNLEGLLQLHMALVAFSEIPSIDDQVKQIAGELREKRDELASLDLPNNLKLVLGKRLTQVIAALDYYYQFGAEETEAQLEGLMAKLALASIEAPKEKKKFFSSVLEKVEAAYKGVRAANRLSSEAEKLVANADEALNLIGQLSDKI